MLASSRDDDSELGEWSVKILLLPCCLIVGVRVLIKEIPLAPLLSWYTHRLLVSSLLANPKCNALPTPLSLSLSRLALPIPFLTYSHYYVLPPSL